MLLRINRKWHIPDHYICSQSFYCCSWTSLSGRHSLFSKCVISRKVLERTFYVTSVPLSVEYLLVPSIYSFSLWNLAYFRISFLFNTEYSSILCIKHYSSINGHVGYFYLLAIVNNAAVNMGCPIPLSTTIFKWWWRNTIWEEKEGRIKSTNCIRQIFQNLIPVIIL